MRISDWSSDVCSSDLFWVSGLALVLLITALPWAGVWGSAFKAARPEMGWVQGTQDWTLGGDAPSSDVDSHARHAPVAMLQPWPKPAPATSGLGLNDIFAKAQREQPAFHVPVSPPAPPGPFSPTAT